MTITQMHTDDGTLAGTVARRVRGLLAELGMDRKDLGPILGVSISSAAKRARGDMPFSIDELPTLASALGTSIEYLLGLTDERGAPLTHGYISAPALRPLAPVLRFPVERLATVADRNAS